jgi:DNA-binding MurR/RpiR family transcriptional regulator
MLHTVANETRYRPEAMSSQVAQLAIIDTLVGCCALTNTARSVHRLHRRHAFFRRSGIDGFCVVSHG